MIKRAIFIDTGARLIKDTFVDLSCEAMRQSLCQSDSLGEVPFGGLTWVLLDQLAVYRKGQTWCAIGNFPCPFGGRIVFFQQTPEGEIQDYMRTVAFFEQQVSWISPNEAELFIREHKTIPLDAIGTVDKFSGPLLRSVN